MSIVLEIVGNLLTYLVPDFVSNGKGTDRRLIARDKVRCGIRAVEGRVLNIGTEWSTGVCEIRRGHLQFVPSMGIVGDREINVVGLRLTEVGRFERVVVSWAESTELIITTDAGELYWLVPKHIADEVIAKL